MKSLESKRCYLRDFTPSDFTNLAEMMQDPEVVKHTGFRVPQTDSFIKQHLQKQIDQKEERFGVWAASLKETQELVGWFMLKDTEQPHLELGFMIRKKYWGQGLASEINQCLMDYADQELGLERVIARCNPDNFPSMKVLEKIGFRCWKKEPSTHWYERLTE